MSEKTTLSIEQITARLKAYNFPKVDLVVGITSGASVPAKMIADLLNLPLRYIRINFRDAENNPKYDKPLHINTDEIPKHFKYILLVDDVSVSGKTLQCAIDNLPDHTIYTFVLKGKADHVLFPEVNTCVNWPWKIEN
jgi:hypoxanthine phosphoribosyltransferase